MDADAVEAHRMAELRIGRFGCCHDLTVENGRSRGVAGNDAKANDLRAGGTLPAECLGGKPDLLGTWAMEDVAAEAELGKEVGQRRGMPKRVDVVGNGRSHAKLVFEVTEAAAELLSPALLGDEIAVRLDELAPDDVPLASGDKLLNPLVHIGCNVGDLPVEPRFAA